jgi:hypothetical protein
MAKYKSEKERDLGQVFTPRWLVDQMLDRIPLWDLPVEELRTKTWLEPSCGDGNFIVAIIERLMAKYQVALPDISSADHFQWIMCNQIFGVELDPEQHAKCLTRVNDLAHSYGSSLVHHHLITGDFLKLQPKLRTLFPERARRLGIPSVIAR